MSLIGKSYIAFDNSYTKRLDTDNQEDLPSFAGTVNSDPKESKIISEPYMLVVGSFKQEYKFIDVEYNGEKYRVLYHALGVDSDLNEALLENDLKRQEYDDMLNEEYEDYENMMNEDF